MDFEYMRRAISLARQGAGFVNPNPLVGAVIVKDNRIIGEGYHRKYGELHAERNAFADCKQRGENAAGAEMYVTLEPCCHYGKTPPCTEAIIENGIKKVYIGSNDPNPLVAGKGIQILREHGILVETEVLKEECDSLNEIFFHYIKTKRPYVVMKYAMTLDGKIATYLGESKWVTGEEARKRVHEDRHRLMAIMTGVGTVLKDNPQLTCRIDGGKNPIRIICDTHLKTPLTANVVTTAGNVRTIIATCNAEEKTQRPFTDAGCQVLLVKEETDSAGNKRIDLNDLMEKLGNMGIDSILLEGGSALNWSALSSGIVQKVQTYIAPKIFGGEQAKSPVGGIGADIPSNAFGFEMQSVTRFGNDILIESICKK
jgi:diaminohydroxyphosphoribosylaminopyrimidine deaminase/5-amino-6-(5-phosphoribosylamino)uracil reductase